MINKLKRIARDKVFFVFIKMIPAMICEYWKFSKHMARTNMYSNRKKFAAEITLTYHALEKGLSLENPKVGYGEDKALKLISDLEKYQSIFGFEQSLNIPLSVLDEYVKFKNENMYESDKFYHIVRNLERLRATIEKETAIDNVKTGIYKKSAIELSKDCSLDFSEFLNTRFSVRQFSGEEVPQSLILQALRMAQKTPSSCNRQAYRAHVFSGKKKEKILDIQGGSRGFNKKIDKAILITGDYNKYFSFEPHLSYVDASLFGMTLIYSLHSLGIATIPLTMEIGKVKQKQIYKEFNIPENEILTLLVGVGQYPDTLEVGVSHREPYSEFSTFH